MQSGKSNGISQELQLTSFLVVGFDGKTTTKAMMTPKTEMYQ